MDYAAAQAGRLLEAGPVLADAVHATLCKYQGRPAARILDALVALSYCPVMLAYQRRLDWEEVGGNWEETGGNWEETGRKLGVLGQTS